MSRQLAGWFVFCLLCALTWAVAAPIVAGYQTAAVAPMRCPRIALRHGVGSDLRTFTVARDNCAESLHAGQP